MKRIRSVLIGSLVFIGLSFRLVTLLKPTVDSIFQTSPVPEISFSKHVADRIGPIRHLVVHSFTLPTEQMIKRLDELGLSTHYLIDTTGRVVQLVPDDKVAWHAGQSYWRGEKGLNATSIGIELQSASLGQKPFTPAQIAAFQKLAKRLINRYHIDPRCIVSHSDIAPTRKADVGKAFPWAELAAAGIGLWPMGSVSTMNSSDEAALLAMIGYDITDVDKALLAFERRFMPELIDTDNDVSYVEKKLATAQPVRNDQVLHRLNVVAQAFR